MWGATWLDHLRLILPLGIAFLLLVRYLLATRRAPEDVIHVLRPAPWETRRAASGTPTTLDVLALDPPHPGSAGEPRLLDHAEAPRPGDFPEDSHAPRFAELPAYAAPLTEPEPDGRAEHDEDTEPTAEPESPSDPGFAGEAEPPMEPAFADDAPTIRMVMHEGSPIEFLPGRLEILEGLPSDQEFRFQRVLGGGVPEVTLGRAPGPAYRHIQLSAPTVSRIHARMRFENDRWVIRNLSEANPLYVQGQPMGESHVLVDGDEVQIGEVLLRYRDGRR